MIKLRPEQAEIIHGYSRGQVGVAAVPGSGKTFTLAHIAARLIHDQRLEHDQEVLIVTFTNSAVNSFQARIAHLLRDQYGLLPYVGYRVRTLHGLAHDIVRERPALVGLADDFSILDESASLNILHSIVGQHLETWGDRLVEEYAGPEIPPKKACYQFGREFPGLVTSFVKRAKDLRLAPEAILASVYDTETLLTLVHFAAQVYEDYQRSLAYRGAVDFDDLVWLALEALARDEQYWQRLQDRWPYILEDEAQDSSQLQEEMLGCLSRERKNWIRVGDPNQAINTTFTTADPRYLLQFLDTPGVKEKPLSVSGRSTPAIVALANELVRWTVEDHPTPPLRDAFTLRDNPRRGPLRGVIQLTDRDDPQPNPENVPDSLHILYFPGQKMTPDQELDAMVAGEEYSLYEWWQEIQELPEDQRPTVAVLVPQNSRGFKLARELRRYTIPYEELLRSTTATRESVNLLHVVLAYLANPTGLRDLKQLFWDLMASEKRQAVREDTDLRDTIAKLFTEIRNIEDFLWPFGAQETLLAGHVAGKYTWVVDDLANFRVVVRRWLQAMTLPVDQLVLTVGQDLFDEPSDIALVHKVAVLLRGLSQEHPEWRLGEFVEELKAISGNQRRFLGFDDAEAGYEPKPGVVTVATMHAAKGLEWDRVYLMSVSNYDFPAAMPYDSYLGERWFVRDQLNLEAELLAQLEGLAAGGDYTEGEATLQARLDYSRERLRLLYVGITRARRELVLSWNMGRFWQRGKANQPALPLVMLKEYMEV